MCLRGLVHLLKFTHAQTSLKKLLHWSQGIARHRLPPHPFFLPPPPKPISGLLKKMCKDLTGNACLFSGPLFVFRQHLVCLQSRRPERGCEKLMLEVKRKKKRDMAVKFKYYRKGKIVRWRRKTSEGNRWEETWLFSTRGYLKKQLPVFLASSLV